MAVITAALSNFISSDIIKQNIHRLRPCNEPAIANWLRILPGLHLPQSSSFTSSHAANHFSVAMFFYATLKDHIGKWAILFFIWAAGICYAQMYVGVHYPTDIIAGALVGLLIGYGTSYFFNKKWQLA
jgi:membrane-associated phospholipid phosphatase